MDEKPIAVDMISVCSADGNIQPLRMQFRDDTRQVLRVNIESVMKCEDVTIVGAEAKVFLCKANVWGQKWVFELKYSIRSHTWSLLRRLN